MDSILLKLRWIVKNRFGKVNWKAGSCKQFLLRFSDPGAQLDKPCTDTVRFPGMAAVHDVFQFLLFQGQRVAAFGALLTARKCLLIFPPRPASSPLLATKCCHALMTLPVFPLSVCTVVRLLIGGHSEIACQTALQCIDGKGHGIGSQYPLAEIVSRSSRMRFCVNSKNAVELQCA